MLFVDTVGEPVVVPEYLDVGIDKITTPEPPLAPKYPLPPDAAPAAPPPPPVLAPPAPADELDVALPPEFSAEPPPVP